MISSKYYNIITAVVLMIVLCFTSVFLFLGYQPDVVDAMALSEEMPYEKVFNQYEVMEIAISIAEEDWQDMLANPTAEEYKACDVKVNGTSYTEVAIRTKGNTSLSQVASSDSDRYSFKIEFDHYDKNKSLEGLDKLVLNNLFCDATYVKEYIAYDIFNYLGVETPYCTFANITVNGENYGCYLALEAMEDAFLERVYQSEGELYKPESIQMAGNMKAPEDKKLQKDIDVPEGMEMPEGMEFPEGMEMPEGMEFPEGMEMSEGMEFPEGMEMPGGMEVPEGIEKTENREIPQKETAQEEKNSWESHGMPDFFGQGGGSDLQYIDDNIESYSDIFDNAAFDVSEEDKQRVITALQKLSEGEALETYVDVDACLRYFAAQTFIVNLDSYYSSLKHNYYLYENNGQITILPWDLNLAFGGFQSGDADDAVNSAIDTPMGGNLEDERPLFSKLMEVAEYKEAYHDYLNDIVTGYVDSGRFTQTLSSIETVIAPYVKEDATAFYSYSEFQKGIETLKSFVLLRAESVAKQLTGEIPSVSAERTEKTAGVDASAITLSDMGMQGGDGAGGKGDKNGNMFGGGPARGGHFKNPKQSDVNKNDETSK